MGGLDNPYHPLRMTDGGSPATHPCPPNMDIRKRKMRFGDNEIDVICRAEPPCGADDGAMADECVTEILNRDTEKYELLSKRSLAACKCLLFRFSLNGCCCLHRFCIRIPNPNRPSRSDTRITHLQFPPDLLSPACRLGELASASPDTVGWDVWEGATQLLCQHIVLHAELVHGKRCVCVCFVSVCLPDGLNRQILSTYTSRKKCEMDRRCEKYRRNAMCTYLFVFFSPYFCLVLMLSSSKRGVPKTLTRNDKYYPRYHSFNQHLSQSA